MLKGVEFKKIFIKANLLSHWLPTDNNKNWQMIQIGQNNANAPLIHAVRVIFCFPCTTFQLTVFFRDRQYKHFPWPFTRLARAAHMIPVLTYSCKRIYADTHISLVKWRGDRLGATIISPVHSKVILWVASSEWCPWQFPSTASRGEVESAITLARVTTASRDDRPTSNWQVLCATKLRLRASNFVAGQDFGSAPARNCFLWARGLYAFLPDEGISSLFVKRRHLHRKHFPSLHPCLLDVYSSYF